MANDTGPSLGRDEVWRRIAAQQVDASVGWAVLHHVLANLPPGQQAAPPTGPQRSMFVKAALEIGKDGDVRERLILGHLVDGEFAEAERRYEALVDASPGKEAELLRRKGALFLVVDASVAREAFDRAVAAAPEDGEAWLGLCIARERLGDRKGGSAAFERASAHGADLSVLNEPEPEPAPATRKQLDTPETRERLRMIRGAALDAAVALFPKARDRFPRLATRFAAEETEKWDLVASVGVAFFGVSDLLTDLEAATEFEADDYVELASYLFVSDTRRRSFSPIPPTRQATFNTTWEKVGQGLLEDCFRFVTEATRALWKSAAEQGLSERERRGRRTRAEEAEQLTVAEWVLGRMHNTNDRDEPEHRLAELGRWLKEAASSARG